MWLLFAFGSALFNAAFGLGQKRIANSAHPIVLSFLVRAWALPVVAIALTILPHTWQVQPAYWLYLALCSSLTVVGTYLTFVAYRLIDFSLAFPILNLIPALALGAAWAIDHERPTLFGLTGVVLIVAGSYWLAKTDRNASKTKVERRSSSRGLWAIVSVAVIFSVTSSYDKLGVASSSPLLWVLGLNVAMALLCLAIIACLPAKERMPYDDKTVPYFPAIVGTAGSLALLGQMFSLQAGGHVAYVLAIKQLSVVFALIGNVRLLKERPDPNRFWSAVTMTVGAIVIGLSS